MQAGHLMIRKQLYQKNLQNTIKDKYCSIKTELSKALLEFENSTTWIKRTLIKFSINRLISNKSVVKLRHDSKPANLIIEKRIQDGIHNNPNEIIVNLTDTTLSNCEIEILKYGLTHGIAIRPKKSEMIMIMEDIYDQIMRHNVVYNSYISTECLKTSLKVFTFNYLDIDDRRYFHDNKRLNALRELRNKFAILKPDIGQGIV